MDDGTRRNTVALQDETEVVQQRAVDHQRITCNEHRWRVGDDDLRLSKDDELRTCVGAEDTRRA